MPKASLRLPQELHHRKGILGSGPAVWSGREMLLSITWPQPRRPVSRQERLDTFVFTTLLMRLGKTISEHFVLTDFFPGFYF